MCEIFMEKIFCQKLFSTICDAIDVAKSVETENQSYNIFEVLKIQDKEVLICRLLGDLLDPSGRHCLGEKPLAIFLRQIGYDRAFSSEELRSARVVLEEVIDENRRIDLVIYIKNFVLPIEVKIWAGDQKNQLRDYYFHFEKENQSHIDKICYLTPDGREPSPYSCNGLSLDQIQILSFRDDIAAWLDEVLGVVENQRIRTTLEEFREVIQSMYKENRIFNELIDILKLGKDDGFLSNDAIKAVVAILSANENEQLWENIRRAYLRHALRFDTSEYELVDDDRRVKDGHSIFVVKKQGKTVAWICVDTNLYIVAERIKTENRGCWSGDNDYYWRYLCPNGLKKTYALKKANLQILNYDSIELGEYLDEIDLSGAVVC